MKLIIGGYAQGKLDYVKQRYENILIVDFKKKYLSFDELSGSTNSINSHTFVINNFHYFVKGFLRKYENAQNRDELWNEHKQRLFDFIDKYQNLIIISDEIGNGIVPIDRFEREYREKTGRTLIQLASRADEVVRVICGMGQKIK